MKDNPTYKLKKADLAKLDELRNELLNQFFKRYDELTALLRKSGMTNLVINQGSEDMPLSDLETMHDDPEHPSHEIRSNVTVNLLKLIKQVKLDVEE